MKKLLIISGIFVLIAGILLAKGFIFTGKAVENPNLSVLSLRVSIPCQGHAGLIVSELKSLGVEEVRFESLNKFTAYYDSSKLAKEDILNAKIFQIYKATELK